MHNYLTLAGWEADLKETKNHLQEGLVSVLSEFQKPEVSLKALEVVGVVGISLACEYKSENIFASSLLLAGIMYLHRRICEEENIISQELEEQHYKARLNLISNSR